MLALNVENIKITATVFLIVDLSTEFRIGDTHFCNIDDTLQTLKKRVL